MPTPTPSRRTFLATSAALGASVAIPSRVRADQPKAPEPPASGAITPDTIAQAEKLAGIDLTAKEREQLSRTIPEQVQLLRARQKVGFLPNDLAPASTFDPRLPGMSFDTTPAKPIVRSNSAPPLPAGDDDIAFAPLTHLSRWIESRQLTSTRLTDLYLTRLKRTDSVLRAIITLTEDHARQRAKQADAEIAANHYRGPLHGIPYGAKDLLDTAGITTTWGAEPWKNRVPTTDATVIRKLNDAGAVLVAKTSLGALAYGDIWFDARTNNPWNPKQGSSGSSAGSAATTAAGCVGFSIGTETYGSIMSPSMVCGTTGLRPTFGRVSRAGAMALCWSLDKVGPICRSVEDAAIVLGVIQGHDNADPSSIAMPYSFDATRTLKNIKVGYNPRWFQGQRPSPVDAHALDVMKSLGVELVEIDLPDWPYPCLLPILQTEAAAAFEELTRTNADDTLKWQADAAWPNTFRQSWFIPAIEFVQADRFRRRVMSMMAERFTKVDTIFAPSQAASLCLITNFTGHPQLTLRAGFRDDNTPRGVTLWGRLFDEGTLCTLGMALEKALDVWHKRPSL
ncbi:MAG: amidase [Planctomycetota bacterium]